MRHSEPLALQHARSGRLAVCARTGSVLEPEHLLVELLAPDGAADAPSTAFVLAPRGGAAAAAAREGEPAEAGEPVELRSAAAGHPLRASAPGGATRELNCGDADGGRGWRLRLYSSHDAAVAAAAAAEAPPLALGEVVKLQHAGCGGLLAARAEPPTPDGAADAMPRTPPTRRVAAPELVRFPAGAAPVGALWVVEGVDGTVGGPLRWGEGFRLRHLTSDHLLSCTNADSKPEDGREPAPQLVAAGSGGGGGASAEFALESEAEALRSVGAAAAQLLVMNKAAGRFKKLLRSPQKSPKKSPMKSSMAAAVLAGGLRAVARRRLAARQRRRRVDRCRPRRRRRH